MLSLAFSDVVVFCCCADVWMLFYITFLHNKVYRRRSIYGGLRRRETRLRQRIRAMLHTNRQIIFLPVDALSLYTSL